MILDGGRLDRRLDLLAHTTVKDTLGDDDTVSTVTTRVYGERLELRTVDATRAGGRESFALARFLIRYREGVTTSLQVRTGDRLYDVVAVDEPDRRRSLVITLEEVTKS